MKKMTLIILAIMACVVLHAQSTTYCTNDSLFYPYQWGLYNDGQLLPAEDFGPTSGPGQLNKPFTAGIDISACDAWQYSEGENIKIGIIYRYGYSSFARYPEDIADNIAKITTITDSPLNEETLQMNGIIAAIRNSIEYVGVAPKSKLYPINIRTKTTQIPQAIDSALAMNVDIILITNY